MAKKLEGKNILLNGIIEVMRDTKAQNIVSLDLKNIESAICKHFIICTGTSNTHVNSIESNIRKTISKKLTEKPFNVEGNNIGEWVLIDYYDIIVHIFQESTRNFYDIEGFWGDAEFTNYTD